MNTKERGNAQQFGLLTEFSPAEEANTYEYHGPTLFTPLTIETVPEAPKPILEAIRKFAGFIPNLMVILAHNPTVLQGHVALEVVFETGSFTEGRQIIQSLIS